MAGEAPAFSADDVINFVLEQSGNGATRALCIGTKSQCAKAQAGFDMLVTFEIDSADLTASARDNLAEVARALGDDRLRAARFNVEGHTDASGEAEYNAELSHQRAESVKRFLIENKVDDARLVAIGRGEDAPRADDPLDPANRRVELRLQTN
ncbi:MAG: OmpA family protein [Phyllobacteriaceae bacterium]|nr:OmpA family protein [Phyllobacteriaceae bacterium]